MQIVQSINMNHIIYSPHLDDAVLCLGGMIAKYIAAGHSVTMHTIFCGHAAPPFSSLASGLHAKWGNPKDMVRLRRAEDAAAAARLGAAFIHGTRQEPIYRANEQGRWLYHEVQDIFGPRNTADDVLVEQIYTELSANPAVAGSRHYFPLGIGHHVDHIIMYEVGQLFQKDGYDVLFYEDFPYAIRDNNFEQRRTELPAFQSVIIPLSKEELDLKIEAFLYYRSQVSMLFKTFDNVPKTFLDFAHSISQDGQSYAERLWVNEKDRS